MVRVLTMVLGRDWFLVRGGRQRVSSVEKILEKFVVFVHEEILDPFSGVACFGSMEGDEDDRLCLLLVLSFLNQRLVPPRALGS